MNIWQNDVICKYDLSRQELKIIQSRTDWAIHSTSVKDKVPLEAQTNDRCDNVLHNVSLEIFPELYMSACLGVLVKMQADCPLKIGLDRTQSLLDTE